MEVVEPAILMQTDVLIIGIYGILFGLGFIAGQQR